VTTEAIRWREPRSPDYEVAYVGLTMDRAALRRRLSERAAAMVRDGLADEVRRLLGRGFEATLPSLQGLGYREFVQVVRGELDEAEALRRMQRDTMRYAKRQWTWFAREPDVQWLDLGLVGGPEGAAALIERRLRQGGLIT
jgi:tRNA dimethylallyltransferase